MSQLFASDGQSIGASASTSVLPINTQDWSLLGWTDWISLQSKGLKRLLQHHSSKAPILLCSAFFIVQLSYPYMTTGKTIALTRRTFVGKVMSLLLNMLSRLVITFLPRSKRLLISWLQPPSAVILEPRKIKSDTVSTVSPSISHEVMGTDTMIFIFWMLSFNPTFSLSTFTFIKRLLSSSLLSAIRVVSSAFKGIKNKRRHSTQTLVSNSLPTSVSRGQNSVTQSCPTLCHPRDFSRNSSPWNSPGQNAGVGSLSLLQGTFPTQGWNPDLQHCREFFTSWATREARDL